MNDNNRAVRSKAHKGFTASTKTNKNKSHFTRKAVSTAVVMALSVLASESAMATLSLVPPPSRGWSVSTAACPPLAILPPAKH